MRRGPTQSAIRFADPSAAADRKSFNRAWCGPVGRKEVTSYFIMVGLEGDPDPPDSTKICHAYHIEHAWGAECQPKMGVLLLFAPSRLPVSHTPFCSHTRSLSFKMLTCDVLLRMFPYLLGFACRAKAIATADDHRVVVYYQTTNFNSSETSHISLLPLIESQPVPVTNVLIAAIHIVDEDNGIRLNDFPPEATIFDEVWSDVAQLQAKGVTVTGMVGGAAKGSFERLDGDDEQFEKYYGPLHDMVGQYNLQGLDLDVEETMSLEGIIRLIDRLKSDFGDDFIISLSPVASALQKGGGNLSGFSYFSLEEQRGDMIDFYNGQFYFGWGNANSASDYQDIIDSGFPAEKVVMGLLTSEENGSGFVALDTVAGVLEELTAEYPKFGGIAGWEYFNSKPGGEAAPSDWAIFMAENLASTNTTDTSGVKFRAKRAFHNAWHVVRRWKRELWRLTE